MAGVFQNTVLVGPPSPSPPGECVPPAFGSGGGHTRSEERGWGVNILEDVRHSSVLYVCKYFVADNLVWQVIYVRPRNIPAFCADLLEARLVERRPGDHGRQPTSREAA